MKHRPILFSTAMVQAILDGRKTQTRRVVKGNPDMIGYVRITSVPNGVFKDMAGKPIKCPYGQPGDVLWVRETYYAFGRWAKNGLTKKGKQKWKFIDETITQGFTYQYCDTFRHEVTKGRDSGWHKRPSLFMPREAAHLFLRIKSVRVERLQEISEGDAIAEGIERKPGAPFVVRWKCYTDDRAEFHYPHYSFRTLWVSINGPESWAANPWVWVVEFEHISREEAGL
jgi:hypothetical protein